MFLFVVDLQEIPLPQSDISLSEAGYYFQPQNGGDWLGTSYLSSVGVCASQCNLDFNCRTFDYNVEPNLCRLFQVEPSPDQIRSDSSLVSQLGVVQLYPELYLAFNQSCEACANDRYLICDQGRCRCPWEAFWNGQICEKQRYAGVTCTRSDQCRDNPYNLTCNTVRICSSAGERLRVQTDFERVFLCSSRILPADLFGESNDASHSAQQQCQ